LQEHNSLEHEPNPTQTSDNEQHHLEASIHAQPFPIVGSNGKINLVIPSFKNM
jgi:hypothetical protein